MTDLRETAKGEQEPVFWMDESGNLLPHSCKSGEFSYLLRNYNIPLYAAPLQREWEGLDDLEIMGMTCECVDDGTFNMDCAYDFARAIEAKLKERNARQQE